MNTIEEATKKVEEGTFGVYDYCGCNVEIDEAEYKLFDSPTFTNDINNTLKTKGVRIVGLGTTYFVVCYTDDQRHKELSELNSDNWLKSYPPPRNTPH